MRPTAFKSTRARYGLVAMIIHWFSALALIAAFAGGIIASRALDPLKHSAVLRIHVLVAASLIVLTLIRIGWWAVVDKKPLPLGQPRWQRLVAKVVHTGLYIVTLLMGSSGAATLLLSGALAPLLHAAPLPDFSGLLPRLAHGWLSLEVLGLVFLHVSAACYHQFMQQDRLMGRMGIGAAPEE